MINCLFLIKGNLGWILQIISLKISKQSVSVGIIFPCESHNEKMILSFLKTKKAIIKTGINNKYGALDTNKNIVW